MYTTTCNLNIDIDMIPEYEYLNLECPNKCNKLICNYNKNNYDGLFSEWEVYLSIHTIGLLENCML